MAMICSASLWFLFGFETFHQSVQPFSCSKCSTSTARVGKSTTAQDPGMVPVSPGIIYYSIIISIAYRYDSLDLSFIEYHGISVCSCLMFCWFFSSKETTNVQNTWLWLAVGPSASSEEQLVPAAERCINRD